MFFVSVKPRFGIVVVPCFTEEIDDGVVALLQVTPTTRVSPAATATDAMVSVVADVDWLLPDELGDGRAIATPYDSEIFRFAATNLNWSPVRMLFDVSSAP